MNGYVLKVKKSEKTIKGTDKIGGYPTYMPSNPPQAGPTKGHFVMELYNRDRDDSDIICWQIYQGEFGGPISDVIEIHKGASLYNEDDAIIEKRRWIDEYEIIYEKQEDSNVLEGISMIGGDPGEEVLEACKEEGIEYVGVIYTDICPFNDLNLGYESAILGKDKTGKLVDI